MNKKVIEDITTESEADQLVQDFIDDGCINSKKHKQENELWTVEALCPEKRNNDNSQ